MPNNPYTNYINKYTKLLQSNPSMDVYNMLASQVSVLGRNQSDKFSGMRTGNASLSARAATEQRQKEEQIRALSEGYTNLNQQEITREGQIMDNLAQAEIKSTEWQNAEEARKKAEAKARAEKRAQGTRAAIGLGSAILGVVTGGLLAPALAAGELGSLGTFIGAGGLSAKGAMTGLELGSAAGNILGGMTGRTDSGKFTLDPANWDWNEIGQGVQDVAFTAKSMANEQSMKDINHVMAGINLKAYQSLDDETRAMFRMQVKQFIDAGDTDSLMRVLQNLGLLNNTVN